MNIQFSTKKDKISINKNRCILYNDTIVFFEETMKINKKIYNYLEIIKCYLENDILLLVMYDKIITISCHDKLVLEKIMNYIKNFTKKIMLKYFGI